MPVPWPIIDKNAVNLIAVAEGRGYNYSFHWVVEVIIFGPGIRKKQLPGFMRKLPVQPLKKISFCKVLLRSWLQVLIFPGNQTLYFEKADWKFMVNVLGGQEVMSK